MKSWHNWRGSVFALNARQPVGQDLVSRTSFVSGSTIDPPRNLPSGDWPRLVSTAKFVPSGKCMSEAAVQANAGIADALPKCWLIRHAVALIHPPYPIGKFGNRRQIGIAGR